MIICKIVSILTLQFGKYNENSLWWITFKAIIKLQPDTVEPPFYVQFQLSQVNNLNVKFLSFKIFLSLVFKSTAPKETLNSEFTSLMHVQSTNESFWYKADFKLI
jgi:hypothetical protein